MTKHQETALLAFNSGLNCAQSVMSAYLEELNIDRLTALSVTCGFGGGMGRLQKTCGAVTGAFMVLSMHHCMAGHDPETKKDRTYTAIQSFHDSFLVLHGTSECGELIPYDLKIPEGRQKMSDEGIYEKVCAGCIADSITILDSLLSAGNQVSSYHKTGA
jgi:C_GCAxxG_C_C family probable redox protein